MIRNVITLVVMIGILAPTGYYFFGELGLVAGIVFPAVLIWIGKLL